MNCISHPAAARRGMSFFEFVGCMSAMIGGVVLGSMYLGVDLKSTAISVLQHAQITSSAPELTAAESTEAAPEGASTAPAASTPSAVEATAAEAAPVEKPSAPELASDANAVEQAEVTTTPTPEAAASEAEAESAAEDEASAPAATSPPALAELINLTDEQRKALTIAYWAAIDQCMKDEVENRVAGIRDSGNLQLFDYLSCRSEGHKAALDRIDKLSVKGVDAHVTAYVEKARAWHQDGARLFARALDLLTDAPTAQLSGPFAQSWQSAATQHRMEERLLSEKHQAVRSYLDHSEQLEAPSPAADAVGQAPAVAE